MRVLLVDDDNSVRDITARMLRRLGCSVDVLTDGSQVESFLRRAGALGTTRPDMAAFAAASRVHGTRSLSPKAADEEAGPAETGSTSGPPPALQTAALKRVYDVIFLDIVMPRLSGDVVCRALVSGYAFPTPIFACSGNALPADLERYRACGFSGVAAKPFSLASLKAKLFEVAAANEARNDGLGLAAGKHAPLADLAVMGKGPAVSGLAESELFAGAVAHVLKP